MAAVAKKETPKKASVKKSAAKKTPRPAGVPSREGTTKKSRATSDVSKPKTTVTLILKGSANQNVHLAGSFNDWSKTSHPMAEKDGVYIITLDLDAGIYEYKFLVNDVWTLDPDPARDWTQNAFGTLNSLLRVE